MKGQARLLTVLAVFGTLAGCRGHSARSVGTDTSNSAQGSTASITHPIMFKRTTPAPAADLATGTKLAFAADRLIALTFDDGPRPYVLFGSKGVAPGLLDILDERGVKATFFVVGWRLTFKTMGAKHKENIGVTAIDAAEQLIRRGHELEDHTFSHIELKSAERKKESNGSWATWIGERRRSRPLPAPNPDISAPRTG